MMDDDAQRIEYTLTLREYLRLYLLRFRHMARVSPVLFFIASAGIAGMFICPAASMLYEYYTSPFALPASMVREEIGIAATPFVEFPVLLAVIMPLTWLLHRRRWLMIVPDGIDSKQHWRKHHLPWRRIAQIEEDGDYLSFVVNMSTLRRMIFITVPKRAFRTEEDAQAFIVLATRYWHQATGRATPASDVENSWPPAPRAQS